MFDNHLIPRRDPSVDGVKRESTFFKTMGHGAGVRSGASFREASAAGIMNVSLTAGGGGMEGEFDPIQLIEVLKSIPYGKFQKVLALFFFISFLATSTLSFNFAFFLIP